MSRLIPTISIFLLFFVVLGGYFFWWPEYQNFQNLRLMLENKKVQLEQAEEYLSELEALFDRLKGYGDELAKVDSALPLDPSIPALFNFIQKTSSENGLILKEMTLTKSSLEEATEKEEVQKIPFSVVVSGSYSGFKNFLSALYKNARIIEVNSVDFSSPSTPEEEGIDLFVFSLGLETHSY